MGLGHSPRIVTDGLVLCLDAANKRSYGGSGTTWTDLKGSNNGTLTNEPTFNTGNGGSIVFDGSDDYINCGNSSSLSIASSVGVSVSVWVKTTDTAGVFIGKRDSGSPNTGWVLYISGGKARFLHQDTSLTYATSSTDVNGGLWHNIVGMRDQSGYPKIYFNGTLEETGTTARSGSLVTSSNLYIADQFGNEANCISAEISNISIYNRALTADEVRQNYLATKERYA